MAISVFDIFKIGIGPSSSHTVGPMRAALLFAKKLEQKRVIDKVNSLSIELYGSLGATGRGHGTGKAVMLGLEGETPQDIDPDKIEKKLAVVRDNGCIRILKKFPVQFNEKQDLHFYRKSLPQHANGMRFIAQDADDRMIMQQEYYSVGGGFVVVGNNIQNLFNIYSIKF